MSATVLRLPEFSMNGESLSGAVPLSALARLCHHLPAAPDGTLDYRLDGGRDAAGRLFLTVRLSARLPLVCRRCLEVFEFPLAASQRFWLRGDGDGGGAFDGAGGEELEHGDVPLLEFLTDELLLSLPPAPAHELSACRAAAFFSSTQQQESSDGCPAK